VGIKWSPRFLDESSLEKKKLAESCSFSWNFSESDCAMADFPTPALPYNQKTLEGTASSSSLLIHLSTV
jgi:hypothetical protein